MDASEFAVHLDQVRDDRAPEVYRDPVQFFDRTYITENLRTLAVETIRRLNGIKVETSAVFNLATQFGGGKTHALTLLYHLASGGEDTRQWRRVQTLMTEAGVQSIPKAATAVFVGTEFDSIQGRGGDDGTPLRKTPWGEIAWQLGGAESFARVEEHERTGTAPGGDVIERLVPKDKPTLILMDELMNYVNRTRHTHLGGQLYSFVQNLSELVRSRDNAVLAVSIPASEFEMTPEDESDHERYKKLLDRLGKPLFMSAETETSEIIRRRLFEWQGVQGDAFKTINEYSHWMLANKHQLPSWFQADNSQEALKATYPFHPSVLSVFERKWQSLPRFQQTRGVLRLLALWVSRAYQEGYQGAHKDPLITLGTAPLEDPIFRSANFEQLGETRLEAAVTTDIVGKDHAHSIGLDKAARNEIRKARLHRKIATSIFFESNGGQQRGHCTLPEIRLAVAEPDLELGNVEQCLEALDDTCYYLAAEGNRYRFSFQPNLNKLLADRRASVSGADIKDKVRAEIMNVFSASEGVKVTAFPEKSNEVPDAPVLRLIVMAPEHPATDSATVTLMEKLTLEYGSSGRTYKSGLIFAVAQDPAPLREEARKLLAWQDIQGDASNLRLDEDQRRQLNENLRRASKNLSEAVWRTYRYLFLLDQNNSLTRHDLGQINSSQSHSMVSLIIGELRSRDQVSPGVSPNFLTRHWPPALVEWSTKAVRDVFFASPKFPRVLDPERVKEGIARGVADSFFAYVGKAADGSYSPATFGEELRASEVELVEDMYIVRKEDYSSPPPPPPPPPPPVRSKCPQCGVEEPTWDKDARKCGDCG